MAGPVARWGGIGHLESMRTHSASFLLLAALLACQRPRQLTAEDHARAETRPGTSIAKPDSPAVIAAAPKRHLWTEADTQFMSGMIGHHAQAIVMAGWASSHAANPSVRILAERIVVSQQDEIASMQTWLADRGLPVPDTQAANMHMHTNMHTNMSAAEHEMHMPGMLTDSQMAQLEKARGAEFDRLFLTFMIQHHRGAVRMVSKLFATYGAAQDASIFKFASDVNVDQSTEIARMETMLASLPH